MKRPGNRVVTVRLSSEEIKYLNDLSVRTDRSRSEVLRGLITRERGGGSLEDKTHETVRYTACLLTALVRRMSKADPGEAESMIARALMEARKEVNS